jgi:hypothetical protein
MLNYHNRKKSQQKKKKKKKWVRRKKIFLLAALKIPYILFHRYTPDTRHNFNHEHPYLAKLYWYLLKFLSIVLKLPIKKCVLCKLDFLPNHRTKKRQRYCGYGCVELNRRRNTRMAKSRYREQKKGINSIVAEYNKQYRERKRNGQVCQIPDLYKVRTERKLRREIKFLYKKLNPESSAKKLKQLDKILRRLSYSISTKS